MLSTNAAMKPSMTPTSWAVPGPGSKRMWGTLTPVYAADMVAGSEGWVQNGGQPATSMTAARAMCTAVRVAGRQRLSSIGFGRLRRSCAVDARNPLWDRAVRWSEKKRELHGRSKEIHNSLLGIKQRTVRLRRSVVETGLERG